MAACDMGRVSTLQQVCPCTVPAHLFDVTAVVGAAYTSLTLRWNIASVAEASDPSPEGICSLIEQCLDDEGGGHHQPVWSSRQENDLMKSYEGGEILSHWRTVCHLPFPLSVCVPREFRAAQDPEEPQARTTVMESTSVTVDLAFWGKKPDPFRLTT